MREFSDLLETMEVVMRLCPWDKEQSVYDWLNLALGEVHELEEAVVKGTHQETAEELGDVLICLVALGRKMGFDMQLVVEAANGKMRRRHPWMDRGAPLPKTAEEAEAQWEAVKAKEKQDG